jgi:hypothetical protein
MSLARAFTGRRAKKSLDISPPMPQGSSPALTKSPHASGSIRDKISAPVELLSTTNMLSYNAPDLHAEKQSQRTTSLGHAPSLTNSSSASSLHSLDVDVSPSLSVSSEPSDTSTVPTSPDSVSSPQDRPAALDAPPLNHLSCYFEKRTSSLDARPEHASQPKVPERKTSHTKSSHEKLARSRSASRVSAERTPHSAKTSISSLVRDSAQMFSAMPDLVEVESESERARPLISAPLPAHAPLGRSVSSPARAAKSAASHASSPASSPASESPFSAELAQVTELAEEYATSLCAGAVRILDDVDDAAHLERAGLCRFVAQDYLAEIESCYVKAYGERLPAAVESWI